MKKSTARGIRPGIFQMPGRSKPVQYLYAETTIRPGTDEAYKSGWVDYVGLYLTPSLDLTTGDVARVPSASDGMHTYQWNSRKYRHVAWAKVPAWWKAWFKKHLDKHQYETAKKN